MMFNRVSALERLHQGSIFWKGVAALAEAPIKIKCDNNVFSQSEMELIYTGAWHIGSVKERKGDNKASCKMG